MPPTPPPSKRRSTTSSRVIDRRTPIQLQRDRQQQAANSSRVITPSQRDLIGAGSRVRVPPRYNPTDPLAAALFRRLLEPIPVPEGGNFHRGIWYDARGNPTGRGYEDSEMIAPMRGPIDIPTSRVDPYTFQQRRR